MINYRRLVVTAGLSLLPIFGVISIYPQQAPTGEKLKQLPPGRHALLERFTAEFGLTYDQQLEIEPLLHAEEAVSKPLLRFNSFSQEEQQATMLKIKLAARRQIRALLTPDQQKKMDAEIDTVAKGGNKGSGGKKAKEPEAEFDAFENEELLSKAIDNYAALTAQEKKAIVLQVKQAARRDDNPHLTPDQQKKIDADISRLNTAEGITRPKILGIAHAAFYVSDLEKTRVFYKDFLGYAEPFALKNADQSADRIAFIKINDHQYIELFNEKPRAVQQLNHISFYTEDAHKMREYLASKGVKVPEKVGKGKSTSITISWALMSSGAAADRPGC